MSRIAFVLDRLLMGGAERHSLALARALTDLGHTVDTIVLSEESSAQFPIHAFPKPPIVLSTSRGIGPKTLKVLGNAITSCNAELVLAVNQTALVASVLSRLTGQHRARVACIFHTTVIGALSGKLKLPLFKLALSQSAALIFVSRNQQTYWRTRGLKARQSFAIPNGIDTDHFRPPTSDERATARARWGFTSDDIVVALCARFAPEKNHGQLIEALQSLLPENPHFKLLLIGDGPLRGFNENIVSMAGLETQVIFTGEQRDVAPILHAADLGVLVSNAVETFSLAALEQMATGLPVVLSDLGGATEMVSHGLNGYVFPVGDTAALVAALRALADPTHRRDLGQNARATVVERFRSEQMVNAYHALLTEGAL